MIERFAWSLINKTMTWKRVPAFLRTQVKDELYRLVQEGSLYDDYYIKIVEDLEKLKTEEQERRLANAEASKSEETLSDTAINNENVVDNADEQVEIVSSETE